MRNIAHYVGNVICRLAFFARSNVTSRDKKKHNDVFISLSLYFHSVILNFLFQIFFPTKYDNQVFKIYQPKAITIKQGRNLDMLENVVSILQSNKQLPQKYCDHNLIGEWQGYKECHISPDWLLIYKIDGVLKLLRLARIGSHSDLFK